MTTTTRLANGWPSVLRTILDLRRGRWVWAAVILLALLPAIGGSTGLIGNYGFLQLSLMAVFAIAVLGLNLLTGFNGQISLGHGAFFAIGGYTTAVLMFHFGVPYWLTLPAAAAMCFVAGYLFGLPALRLEGHYLALATFGLAIAVPQMLKYRHIEELTGGVQGLQLDRAVAPFGLPLTPNQWMFLWRYVAVVMFWIARNLPDSRTGGLAAIRSADGRRDHGINAHCQTVTFGVSALTPAWLAPFTIISSSPRRTTSVCAVDRHPGGRCRRRHRLAAGRGDRRRVRAGDREVRRRGGTPAERHAAPADRGRALDHLRHSPDPAGLLHADGDRGRAGGGVGAGAAALADAVGGQVIGGTVSDCNLGGNVKCVIFREVCS
jgi:hypothetical protein